MCFFFVAHSVVSSGYGPDHDLHKFESLIEAMPMIPYDAFTSRTEIQLTLFIVLAIGITV